MKLEILLNSEEDSAKFAKTLAEILVAENYFPALFFIGDLGAGKTFIIRNICENLPDSHKAEISSPSFSIMNFYPTKPEVCHIDLYRLEKQNMPDELEDAFEQNFVIIEWANFLAKEYYDYEHLLIQIELLANTRKLIITAKTQKNIDFLVELDRKLKNKM